MGIKSMIKKAGTKAADKVAKLAVLSPEQIEEIENRREEYLSQMPSSNDPTANELTSRLLAACGVEIYNAYLSQLQECYVPIEKDAEYSDSFMPAHNIRYINITKWVTDTKENGIEKLVNVYQVLSNEDCNIALVFNRTGLSTNVYLAVINTHNDDNNSTVDIFFDRIKAAVKGNFPGSEWTDDIGKGTIPCFDARDYSVASVSNVPTEKSEKFMSQTIEKLLDGIIPEKSEEEYTVVLLATPVQDVENRKIELSELYSGLVPYASWQTNFTFTDSNAATSSATFGLNAGVSAGVQQGNNKSESESVAVTEGTSETETRTARDLRIIKDTIMSGENEGVGGKLGAIGKSLAKNISNSATKTASETLTKTASIAKGLYKGTNLGGNFGANFARASNVTITVGKNEGIQQSFTNYTIKHTLEILEEQMKRLEQSSAMGMWDFAAYVISEDTSIANNVAHSYLALTQGEKSYTSNAAVNLWRGDMGDDSIYAKEIYEYLKDLRHPLFGLNPSITQENEDMNVYPSVVTATTCLSGKELAYSLNFPQKSVAGLPVIKSAEFGRNVVTYNQNNNADKEIKIGKIFHMNHEENVGVNINLQSLSSHTFITGSTGTGKSNTVYQILNEARKNDIKFLVVEPTKGEYKNVFGSDEDVLVLGTNIDITPILRINPFSFNKNIHVLEHIDRIVEIFNVCWPMYAAMPAVLKDAIEQSYIDCGWDLINSNNRYDNSLYPSFADVERNIKRIIDTSEYDAENKGAYKGSLLTRLKSLTNGINGLIFTNDEITNEELFDNNVIVDISRVGSSETKSLIMAMLVLKLHEYRISSNIEMNSNLRHLTVLEEAHNILKRTSTEQVSESANLVGKSVEMISNSIAEMRTYGEGFIIADQLPSMLDMAAIRNTNTKIIMRLPDQQDREVVGKAASLNDDQITELTKIPRGVAAIYQNEWIQPVLCKISKADTEEKRYEYNNKDEKKESSHEIDRFGIANMLSRGEFLDENTLREIKLDIFDSDLSSFIKVALLDCLINPSLEPRMTKLAPIMKELFPEVYESVRNAYNETSVCSIWTEKAESMLASLNDNKIEDIVRRDIIQSIVTYYLLIELNNTEKLKEWALGGGLK